MKKLFPFAIAMICVLTLSSSTPAIVAQDEGEGDPETTCDEIHDLKDRVCQQAKDAVDLVADGKMTEGDYLVLLRRCKHMGEAASTCPDPD